MRKNASAPNLRSPGSPTKARKGLAIAALPTAVAVGLALLPNATAQSSLGALLASRESHSPRITARTANG